MSDADEPPFAALSEDERVVLDRFLARRVRFIVVGGYAVRVHGCLRPVADLDLLVDPDEGNLQALAEALRDVGVAEVDSVVELFRSRPRCRWHWREGLVDHYVDLLTGIGAWPYLEVEADSVEALHDGLVLRVLSRDKVIADKRAMANDPARGAKAAQDLEDLGCLE